MIETNERFKIDYIDASSISTFSRCPARFLFSRLMALRLPEYTEIAPDFGTCIHRALPLCYNGESGIKAAVDEFKAAWAAFPYGLGDEKRNVQRAEAMLRNFAEMHQKHNCPYRILDVPITAETKDKISPNEVPFLIDIGGSLAAAGRIDLVVEWLSTGDVLAADYKTTQEISARFFDNFNFCPQSCLYTVALKHLYPDRKVRGMLLEALRVSQKNSETQMSFTYLQDHQLSSFLSMANRVSDDILACNSSGKWPKKCTGCGPYGAFGFPSRICEFSTICSSLDWRDSAKIYVRGQRFHPFKMIDECEG